MVKLFLKLSLGIFFGSVLYLGFSFVNPGKVEASHGCTHSGVYSCLQAHIRDGSSSGPWLSGATVTMAIPAVKAGFYCYAPGKSGTLAADTTNSSGEANIDNVCCNSVLTGTIRVMVTKSGYLAWPPGVNTADPNTWAAMSFSNGSSRSLDIYLAPVPLPTNTLNVRSSGASGIAITGTYPGTTNYTLSGTSSYSGTLTAPTVSGYTFNNWSGCDSTSGSNCTVSVSGGASQTVTANYTAVATNNTLNVRSSPVTGISITGSYAGTTNYSNTGSATISGTITAPSTFGSYTFSSWSGCDSTSGRNCTVSVSGGATQTVTANYTAPAGTNTLNVNSSPVTGIAISGTYPGTTNYSQTSSSALSGTITAPSTFGSYTFSNWSGCDSSSGNNCTVSVSGGATQTVTANYTIVAGGQPDLTIQNNSGGTNPGVTVSGATISGNTVSATVGTAVTFTFRTTNIGTSAAGNSTCTVIEAFGSTFSPTLTSCDPVSAGKQWYPVSTIAAGSFGSGSLTTRWNTAGTYSMLFRADAKGNLGESNEGNNDVILTVNVNALQPNLRVLSGSFIYTPGSISIGTPMTIQARIQNTSSSTAVSTQFYNRLQLDTGSGYVTVNPDQTIPSLGTSPASTTVAWSYTPTVGGNHTFRVCADTSDTAANNNRVSESDEGDNCLSDLVPVNSSLPWIKTIGGNVGSATTSGTYSINTNWPTNLCPGDTFYCNSTYMIIAAKSVTNSTFKSAKGWLLSSYNPGLGNKYYNYETFYTGFSRKACPRTLIPNNKGKFIIGSSVTFSGTTDPATCTDFADPKVKNAAVVFINGSLNINSNLTLARPTVFIVRDTISIAAGVGTVNGMFVANGSFTTNTSNQTLRMVGLVAAALSPVGTPLPGGRCGLPPFTDSLKPCMLFDRNAGVNNATEPAEQIIFDPKYLYLLTEFIGVSDSTYRETNP